MVLNTTGNRITYFGHSTFSLTTSSGQVALIDPWVMTNPWCPEELKSVERLDAIFLSHAHTDHMGDLLALAKQHRPKIVAVFETCLWIESKGFAEEACPMGKGGSPQGPAVLSALAPAMLRKTGTAPQALASRKEIWAVRRETPQQCLSICSTWRRSY